MKKTTILALVMMSCAATVNAMATPTLALGERLFNDSSLGTNGNSCASCHPGGKKLEETNAYDDSMLQEMINFCIRDAMKGEMLTFNSTELKSFLIFLRSLEK